MSPIRCRVDACRMRTQQVGCRTNTGAALHGLTAGKHTLSLAPLPAIFARWPSSSNGHRRVVARYDPARQSRCFDKPGRREGIRSSPSPNHNIIRNPRLKRRSYALRLLTRGASAGGIGAETLGFCAMRKARRRCMFLITAACRSTSSFIASAISASRRSIRDAKVSFGSFFSDSGCFASSIIGRPCTRYHV